MRTVFFGTPEWAVPSLEALLAAGTEVVGVVTNPDKPAGRGLEPRPSSVKHAALQAGLEVYQPASARSPEVRQWLAEVAPEAAIVVAYGRILPVELLAVPPLGFVNVHFSLLPAYRGAAPVQRALMDGVETTGVTIMVLTEGMDEGPVLASEAVAVGPDENASQVGERLAVVGARLLVATLPAYAQGSLEVVEQDHSAATYAPKITSDDARIDWSLPAMRVKDLARALDPEPGAWTTLRGGRTKIFSVLPNGARAPLGPGQLATDAGELVVGTGDVPVLITEAQLAGKRRMAGSEIARGLRLAPGDKFE